MKGKKMLTILVVIAMIASTMIVVNELTNIKIFPEPAKATPGIDAWEGNGTINATGNDVLNTSSTYLEYLNTYINTNGITVNGSATWVAATTYYLYYPVYVGKYGGDDYSLTWAKYMGDPDDTYGAVAPEIQPRPAGNDYSFGGTSTDLEKNVQLNRTGLWLIDNNADHNASTPDQMNATIPAWFWVNTTRAFTTIITDNSFKYGDTGTIDITVTQTPGATTPSALCAVHNGSGRLIGTWDWNQPYVDGKVTLGKNDSVFTNAGTWYVDSYYDLDGGTDESGDHVSYLDSAGGAGYDWYNASLYGTDSAFDTAVDYSYATCGPWDPPEYNATTEKITVDTGEPTISLINASAVYWGFAIRMEINVTDNQGNGITGGNVSLRKSDVYIYNGLYGDIWINETGDGNYTLEIPRFASGNWTNIGNGSWYVVFGKDANSDGNEEWNKSKRFSVSSVTPPVRLTITNDGDAGTGTAIDNKVNVPAFTPGANTVGTISIVFQILGTDVGDDQGRAYYGNDAHEDRHNITISGDILYPVTDTTLTHGGNGVWTAVVTPSKPGGTITIAIDWPGSNNGTDSKTINIINGTTATSNIQQFTYGDTVDITITVKDKYGNLQYAADVYLVWKSGPTRLNQTVPGTGAAGKGQNGEYTFRVLSSDLPSSAPDNVTVAAKTPGYNHWGYTSVFLAKSHNMKVNCTPTASYAGDAVEYDIDITANGEIPDTFSDITVALYHPDGTLVTGDDEFSSTGAHNIDDQELILTGGTYYLYAYNDTHDSEGNNATLIITPYSVITSPTILAWLIDTSENVTFAVTPAGNGTLTLNNMTSAPNGSSIGSTETVDILDGQGTLLDVNASDLGNITFEYTSDGGESRAADGLLKITTATGTPNPSTVYIGEATTVEVTVTHPATGVALSGIRVDLDYGVNLSDSKLSKIPDYGTTDANGKVQFAIQADASGNITIYLQRGTDPDNPMIILSAARKTMTITTDPSIEEGGTFIVSAKDANGALITDATVNILFNGVTETTTTGTLELTAPAVPESLDYRIEATAEGYTNDDTTIKVINKPKLFVKAPSKVAADESFTVTAGGDDGNSYGITITIYSDAACTTPVSGKTDTTAGPSGVSFKLSKGTYYIKATKDNYEASAVAEITITEAATPGFELLTLIIALGVAFILFRRRRH